MKISELMQAALESESPSDEVVREVFQNFEALGPHRQMIILKLPGWEQLAADHRESMSLLVRADVDACFRAMRAQEGDLPMN